MHSTIREPIGDAVLAAVDKFSDPGLGLRASREELLEWAAGGASLARPLSPDDAIRRMVPTKHLPLVWRAAMGRARPGPDRDDLFGAGQFGLIHAAGKYDPVLGYRFSTYAQRWIVQAMDLHVGRNSHAVHIPAYVQAAVAEIRRDPGAKLKLTKGQVECVGYGLTAMSRRVVRDLREEGTGSLFGRIVADEARAPDVGEGVDPEALGRLLAALPSDRDRAIFADRYGLAGREPVPEERLGGMHGETTPHIRQVIESGRRLMLCEADRLGLSLDDCLMARGDEPRDASALALPPPVRRYRGVRLKPDGRWAGRVKVGGTIAYAGNFRGQEQCRVAVDRVARERFGIEDYTGAGAMGPDVRLGA
jgi:RNA polymerase sigma factor (sigma-70 family)